jgi:hypothetical protein
MAFVPVTDSDPKFESLKRTLLTATDVRLEVGLFQDKVPEILFYATVNEFGHPGKNIPERPAFRQWFDTHQHKYEELHAQAISELFFSRARYEARLEQLGQVMVEDLRNVIKTGSWEPNAESTLSDKKRRGTGTKPLLDTLNMLNSIEARLVRGADR